MRVAVQGRRHDGTSRKSARPSRGRSPPAAVNPKTGTVPACAECRVSWSGSYRARRKNAYSGLELSVRGENRVSGNRQHTYRNCICGEGCCLSSVKLPFPAPAIVGLHTGTAFAVAAVAYPRLIDCFLRLQSSACMLKPVCDGGNCLSVVKLPFPAPAIRGGTT